MAPLWFLGFGWASRLVWAKVVGPTKYTTAHDVSRSKAQGLTSSRSCTRGINVMDSMNNGFEGE